MICYKAHAKIIMGIGEICNKWGIRWEVDVAHHVLLADEPIEARSFGAGVSAFIHTVYRTSQSRRTTHQP